MSKATLIGKEFCLQAGATARGYFFPALPLISRPVNERLSERLHAFASFFLPPTHCPV